MQYMVMRYFGKEYGWSIKGFHPASSSSKIAKKENELSTSPALSAVKVLASKLPGYAGAAGEKPEGFTLHDVVALVVVLERLIFDEGMEMLEDAYYLQSKEVSDLLNPGE